MVTYSGILTWRIAWTEDPGRRHTVHGVAEPHTTERLTTLSEGVPPARALLDHR